MSNSRLRKADIFVSYVEKNSDVVKQLAEGLEKAGYTTWYYERDALPGVTYLTQVREAIDQARVVLVVISQDFLRARASHTTNEVVRAYEQGKPFIPVLRDITHAELQERKPDLAQCLGAAVSIRIPPEGVLAILPRIERGLLELGVRPAGSQEITSASHAGQDSMAHSPAEAGLVVAFARAMEYWKHLQIPEARDLLCDIHGIDPLYKHPGWTVNVGELLRERRPDWRKSILIVVGAMILPQIHDGEDATELRNEINRKGSPEKMEFACVVTDVGLLAEQEFMRCPLIAIGGPVSNKLTADIVKALPRDPVSKERITVQHSMDQGDRRVALWGNLAHETTKAVNLFVSSGLLDRFLDMIWKRELKRE
ncbi:MAG: toll/interleukin-1 receptor domain-containing protein [Candidatus Eisenbacteria bacterium]|nr:toll/interleukin-1 receptor domain-containing protein [Candidatus Eisenbacteria bacterium]